MKIAFITTRLSGGAGIACRRLWEGMQASPKAKELTLIYRKKADIIAKKWTSELGATKETVIYKHANEWPDEKTSAWLNENRSSFTETYLSAIESSLPYDDLLVHACHDADAINIHWTSGLLSATCWKNLIKLSSPILVNLHDFNYITGGCHYPAGCTLYTTSCTHCPQVTSRASQEIIFEQHKLKQLLFDSPNIFWTAPSGWLVDKIKQSSTISRKGNILNAHRNIIVDERATNPHPQTPTPKEEKKRITIGLVADNLTDSRKGIYIGAKAVTQAASLFPKGCAAAVHLIGTESSLISNFINSNSLDPHRVLVEKNYGKLDSDSMQQALGSLDILLFPSLEENYSNLLIEAISAGTTCLGFAIGGNLEIAAEYPHLMQVVGRNLNIKDGVNSCQVDIVYALAKAMATTLASFAPQNSNLSAEAASCRAAHSRRILASKYTRTFNKLIHKKKQMDWAKEINIISREWPIRFSNSCTRNGLDSGFDIKEPVAWIDLKDTVLRSSTERPSGSIFVYCLKPSWEKEYYENSIGCLGSCWEEYNIVTHDIAYIKELEYWDMQLLVFDASLLSQLNITNEYTIKEFRAPALCAWHSPEQRIDLSQYRRTEDLIWECILNECILQPMNGIHEYSECDLSPPAFLSETSANLRSRNPISSAYSEPSKEISLSTKVQAYTHIDGPVLWLPRHLVVDFKINYDEALTIVAHVPSWDSEYMQDRTGNSSSWSLLHRIPHHKSQIDELKYWDTIICQIHDIGHDGRIFSDGHDEDLTMATSFIAITDIFSPEEAMHCIRDSLRDGAPNKPGILFHAAKTLQSLFGQLDLND